MTDREMLELAAKAAGINLEPIGNEIGPSSFDGEGLCKYSAGGFTTWRWRPLTDDGDAFRLAMVLRLSIDHNHPLDQSRYVVVERQGCEGCYAPVCCIGDEFDESERVAATRRAIVRAAAEIGKAMP